MIAPFGVRTLRVLMLEAQDTAAGMRAALPNLDQGHDEVRGRIQSNERIVTYIAHALQNLPADPHQREDAIIEHLESALHLVRLAKLGG